MVVGSAVQGRFYGFYLSHDLVLKKLFLCGIVKDIV
jgi:hypothetical protein